MVHLFVRIIIQWKYLIKCLHLLIYLPTYLLTFSMEQSPSWEVNNFSASQDIPRILWNPKAHYLIHKYPPPVPVLSHIDLVLIPHPTSWRSILILSFHLRLGLRSGLFLSVFPPKPRTRLSSPPYALHAPPISFFSILSPEQYRVRSVDHEAPRYGAHQNNDSSSATFQNCIWHPIANKLFSLNCWLHSVVYKNPVPKLWFSFLFP